jgi:putative acetyltransferase
VIEIREERAGDEAAVRRVNELAFGQQEEAALVDALRGAADPHVSLVATDGGEIVGHIFFSPVTIEPDDSTPADSAFAPMGLAPMAVLPEYQRRGVGSALVRAGLEECRRAGYKVVVVLGHAEYYPRFGFRPAGGAGLRSEYPVPDEVFMVAELEPGALAGRRGLVKYHPAFAGV